MFYSIYVGKHKNIFAEGFEKKDFVWIQLDLKQELWWENTEKKNIRNIKTHE